LRRATATGGHRSTRRASARRTPRGDVTDETTVDAVNRRGRHTRVRAMGTAFLSSDASVNGALLLI
jgi:hypothetical protein